MSPPQPPRMPNSAAGSTLAYAVVLLLVTAFIVYGSLYPFVYRERTYPGGPVYYLLSTWGDWDHRGDLLSNVLLYLPFGFFGTYALPSRLPAWARAALATVAGVVLSSGMEAAQFHDVDRVTSMGDVYANAIGSAAGAIAAAIAGASIRWPFVRELTAHPVATLLLVMFLGYRLYPYVPVIDLHKYWHALWPVLRTPSLPPGQFARYLITWLFIAAVIHSLYGFRRFLILFPAFCSVVFLGKIIIVDNVLTMPRIAGAGLAFLLWAVLLRRLSGRFGLVAVLFGAMVLAERLEPFTFTDLPHAFGWVPFSGFMHGSINVAMQAFCQKFYEYGGLIWLLNRAGMPLPAGSALTAVMLLLSSIAECWLPGRSAEITDAIMALIIGGAFGLLRAAARGRRVPAVPRSISADIARGDADAMPAGEGSIAPAASGWRGRAYASPVPPRRRG